MLLSHETHFVNASLSHETRSVSSSVSHKTHSYPVVNAHVSFSPMETRFAGLYNPDAAQWAGWRVLQVVVALGTYSLVLAYDDD